MAKKESAVLKIQKKFRKNINRKRTKIFCAKLKEIENFLTHEEKKEYGKIVFHALKCCFFNILNFEENSFYVSVFCYRDSDLNNKIVFLLKNLFRAENLKKEIEAAQENPIQDEEAKLLFFVFKDNTVFVKKMFDAAQIYEMDFFNNGKKFDFKSFFALDNACFYLQTN